ncbi:hypothetical protein [Acidovorax sp. sic0104]|uniref:hypothetical protein n=1 Tax=Acidovorax sp. sic0104 TaxID=2854784 RepID=UPI001C496C34|nr:hypothetical protein [Acidovorax sp. sic0104]MBV7542126.1 hypothetical protein [Acidovorax sp. sic0104]
MDSLTLRAARSEDGIYQVSWQWARGNQRVPSVGVLHVSVDEKWTKDRAALAELRAIFHLLHEREIHGNKRLGGNVAIRVSDNIIVQALQKKSLKVNGVGRAVATTTPVVPAVEFLATKYFEAEVSLAKWVDPTEYRQFEAASIAMGQAVPVVLVDCPLIGQPVRISRHAMNRYIARIDQKLHKLDENDLTKVPNGRWPAAWGWFNRVLVNANLQEALVSQRGREKVAAKYGEGTRYLRFPDANNAIFVVRTDERGPVLATVLLEDLYNPFFERAPVMKGQQLMTSANAMVKRAGLS